MFKRRSPPQMTPSDRVRKLWVEFETWHKEQTFLIEQQVTTALHELDAKWRQTPSKKRSPKADHEKRKKTKREEIEKTFNGNMVREEWQKRLDKEGLQSDDWTDLTDAEQKRVEEILGADLELEEVELPVVQVTPQKSGSLFAPPMSSDSRLGSVSDTYTVVKPGAFKMVTEEPWMQVIQKSRSDDELSLDASTTSSWGLSTNDGAAYRSWSSEASRSSTQTSHASSPEHQTQYLSAEVKQQSLLSAAARRLSEATQRPSRNDSKLATSQSLIPLSRTESLDSTSDDPMSFIGEPQKTARAAFKSRATYIGPHLAESTTDADEEAEFHRFKMDIRIQKIREFHDEAALADIKLTVEIDDARRLMQSNKDYEAKLLEEHEQKMLQLRKSKEEERKSIVEAERLRRRSTMRVRGQPPPPPPQQQQREPAVDTSDCEIPPSVAAQFLKGLKEMEGSTDPGGLSDTSTIRQQQRPSRKPSLFTDWMHSGGDTPTPTARVSAWTAHSSQLSQTPLAESSDMFADAPLSKRGVPDTHSRSRGVPDATPTQASEVSPWSTKNVTSSIPGAWDSELVASHTVDNTPAQPERVGKVEPAKATAVVMGKGKKKKGKQAPTEIESSSINSKTKAGTAVSPTTISPGPPSSSAKTTKENSTAKSQNEGAIFSPEIDRATTPSAKSTPVWNTLPKSKVPPSSAISPSNSSSSTWSSWTSSSSTSQSTTDDQQFWVPGSASKPTADPRAMNPSSAGKWPSTGPQASDSSTSPPPPSNSTAKSPVISKSAGKKPEVPQASANTSSILKKPGSSKTKIAKGSKKKKVTIEEVSDDEGEEPAPDGVERLPSDSRYIIQPAEEDLDPDQDSASAPAPALGSRRGVEPGSSSMFGQQQPQQQQPDGYSLWNQATSSSSQDSTRWVPPSQGQGQQGQGQGQVPERWIPTPQGRRESGDFWLPGGFNQPTETTSNSRSSRPTFDWNTQGKSGSGSSGTNSNTNGYATWTPSVRSTGGGHGRRNFEGDPEQDLFLSALDSLENIVRGNEHSHSRNDYGGYGGGEADNLGRLLSGVGRGLDRERNGDGGDALWQAIQQYGQRGTGAATPVW